MNASSHPGHIQWPLKLGFKRNHMGSWRKTANSSSVMGQESRPALTEMEESPLPPPRLSARRKRESVQETGKEVVR